MNKEEKELLLRDLCARLPYGVNVVAIWKEKLTDIDGFVSDLTSGVIDLIEDDEIECKPYLRSMPSMTEEEINEYLSECDKDNLDTLSAPHYHGTDWLNKKMFDYRRLIPMGLALEAPKDMYNIKTE